MSDLTALKVRKLGQQQELAKEFNFILTRQVRAIRAQTAVKTYSCSEVYMIRC